jgi:hypothetical protein
MILHIIMVQKNPKIDDAIRQIPILLSPSDLQGKILSHICTRKNASYASLIKDIKKDRITILQSIESLIKYHYIEKEKIHPEREKSKLIFIPTLRGKARAWSYFGLNVKDMVKTKKEDLITNYIEFIKDVFPSGQHKPVLSLLFSIIERDYLNIEEEGFDTKKRLIKEAFVKGLFELVQEEDYYPAKLFNNKTTEWLTKLYSVQELSELKELFIRTKKNLAITVEKFPV